MGRGRRKTATTDDVSVKEEAENSQDKASLWEEVISELKYMERHISMIGYRLGVDIRPGVVRVSLVYPANIIAKFFDRSPTSDPHCSIEDLSFKRIVGEWGGPKAHIEEFMERYSHRG